MKFANREKKTQKEKKNAILWKKCIKFIRNMCKKFTKKYCYKQRNMIFYSWKVIMHKNDLKNSLICYIFNKCVTN